MKGELLVLDRSQTIERRFGFQTFTDNFLGVLKEK